MARWIPERRYLDSRDDEGNEDSWFEADCRNELPLRESETADLQKAIPDGRRIMDRHSHGSARVGRGLAATKSPPDDLITRREPVPGHDLRMLAGN
jgi:hypothetical protein